MLVVYVAGPSGGEHAWAVEQNIRRAEEVAYRIAQSGHAPLCPHTNSRFFDGTLTGQFWLDAKMALMERCDVVVFCGEWAQSEGSLAEHKRALWLRFSSGITQIYYSIDHFERVHGSGGHGRYQEVMGHHARATNE